MEKKYENATKENYKGWLRERMPRSKHLSTMLRAFLVGGLICSLAELIGNIYTLILPSGEPEINIKAYTTMTIITLTAILTGFGIYDKLGTFAGGGSLVPITGFSNSMTAAAMEHRKEGIVFGTCANMFKIAGPVIVFGVALSMLVGFIYWIISLFA